MRAEDFYFVIDATSADVTEARWRRAAAAKKPLIPFTQRWDWDNNTHFTHTFVYRTS